MLFGGVQVFGLLRRRASPAIASWNTLFTQVGCACSQQASGAKQAKCTSVSSDNAAFSCHTACVLFQVLLIWLALIAVEKQVQARRLAIALVARDDACRSLRVYTQGNASSLTLGDRTSVH